MNTERISPNLNIVGPIGKFPKVKLIEPPSSGYVLLALKIDRRLPFAYGWESRQKKKVLASLKESALRIAELDNVIEATVFKTLIAPPGRGKFLKKRPHVKIARFDVAMLVELNSPAEARAFKESAIFIELAGPLEKEARASMVLSATSGRHIGPVDHSRDGVFLFNYFYSDSLEQNLKVWEYTAGWFQDQAGLRNSVLMVPEPSEHQPYTVVNHCRWDRLRDILPGLLFKKSFRSFVLNNFVANNTAPIPILYKLA